MTTTTTTTTATNETLAARMLADMEARRENLAAIQASGIHGGFVIKCGPMCIKVHGAQGEHARACGIEGASRYAQRANAERIAPRITNGAGAQGRVVSYQDAVADELQQVTMALDALRQALAPQA